MNRMKRAIAVVTAGTVVFGTLGAQTPQTPNQGPLVAPASQAPPASRELGGLRMVVLQGEGAFNDIQRKTGRDPVVEVRDENDRPLAGAQVVFSLPESGAGGTFEGGIRTFTTTSDPNGMASARGLKPNSVEGRFQIRVMASVGGKTGTVAITQSNTLAGGAVVPGQHGGGGKKWLLLLVAGGAASGILAAKSGGSKSTPPPAGPAPTILSTGTVTVGGPR